MTLFVVGFPHTSISFTSVLFTGSDTNVNIFNNQTIFLEMSV